MTLAPDDIQFLVGIIKKRSGIVLTEQKSYLLDSRLLPVAKSNHFETLAEMVKALRLTQDEAVLKAIIEAITTNESSFFRDITPFEQFRNVVLPYLTVHMPSKKKFRIWSAACSQGQEPYSIAMSLLEDGRYKDYQFDIVATDISIEALEKAKSGLYTQFEVQRGVPITYLVKYFEKEGECWRLRDQVRSMVQFQSCNLVGDFSQLGVFDIIFCRNVLIYFDQETKNEVLLKLSRQLEPHGLIFLSGTEGISAKSSPFSPLEDSTGIHRLVR